LFDFDKLYLDVGCGNMKRGNIGIDLQRWEDVDVIADMHNLPFRSSSIDGCFAYGFLEHAENPIVVVKEINRILKINGWLKIRIPRDSRMRFDTILYLVMLKVKKLHEQYEFSKSGVHKFQISGRQLKRILSVNGFDITCFTFLELRRENRKTHEVGNFFTLIFQYCRSVYALAYKTAEINRKYLAH